MSAAARGFASDNSATIHPAVLKAIARVKPGETEVGANPRARSAIMRVAERTEVEA